MVDLNLIPHFHFFLEFAGIICLYDSCVADYTDFVVMIGENVIDLCDHMLWHQVGNDGLDNKSLEDARLQEACLSVVLARRLTDVLDQPFGPHLIVVVASIHTSKAPLSHYRSELRLAGIEMFISDWLPVLAKLLPLLLADPIAFLADPIAFLAVHVRTFGTAFLPLLGGCLDVAAIQAEVANG